MLLSLMSVSALAAEGTDTEITTESGTTTEPDTTLDDPPAEPVAGTPAGDSTAV